MLMWLDSSRSHIAKNVHRIVELHYAHNEERVQRLFTPSKKQCKATEWPMRLGFSCVHLLWWTRSKSMERLKTESSDGNRFLRKKYSVRLTFPAAGGVNNRAAEWVSLVWMWKMRILCVRASFEGKFYKQNNYISYVFTWRKRKANKNRLFLSKGETANDEQQIYKNSRRKKR